MRALFSSILEEEVVTPQRLFEIQLEAEVEALIAEAKNYAENEAITWNTNTII